MIQNSEISQMGIVELRKAIETKEATLDAAADDLQALPYSGGTPGQQKQAVELAAKLEDGQIELKQMHDRLAELEPPAPAQFSIF